jgi:hypothetical protein
MLYFGADSFFVRVSPSTLPSYARTVPLPQWNDAPIAFPSTGLNALRFTGLQTAQLLHGVEYRLDALVQLNGIVTAPPCDALPFNYTASSTRFSLAPCGSGFLAVNFTQICVVCPLSASCINTRIFAAPRTSVWRPTSNSLPFVDCLVGSKGCYVEDAWSRSGFECAPGYTGPLCGACDEGYGRAGSGGCTTCFSLTLNLIVVLGAVAVVFCAFTYIVIGTTKNSTPSIRVQIGQQGIKLLTNHFSLFSILISTAIAASLKSSARAALALQHAASSPSPTSNTFASCLLPQLTANEVFSIALIAVPFLAAVEIVIVRVVHSEWEVASVSAAVLQLSYMQVIDAASKMLRHRSMTFYESALYATGNISTSDAILSHFDVLEADVRINFADNTGHYALAWVVLCVFGIGVPLWFVGAFVQIRKSASSVNIARRKLRFLVGNYKASQWYWESVITTRKGLSVVLVASLADYPVLQMQSLMILFSMYVIAQERYAPFLSQRRQTAERTSYASAIFTCNAMLAIFSVDDSEAFGVIMTTLMLIVQLAALAAFGRVLYLDYTAARRQSATVEDDLAELMVEGDVAEEVGPSTKREGPDSGENDTLGDKEVVNVDIVT